MGDLGDDNVEVEFREGLRWVPGYIARQLPLDETYTMTYAEAMEYINHRQFQEFANDAQQRLVDSHFRHHRG